MIISEQLNVLNSTTDKHLLGMTQISGPGCSKGGYRCHCINHYLLDSVACFVEFIHWIAIYPVDSVIQPSNNWSRWLQT